MFSSLAEKEEKNTKKEIKCEIKADNFQICVLSNQESSDIQENMHIDHRIIEKRLSHYLKDNNENIIFIYLSPNNSVISFFHNNKKYRAILFVNNNWVLGPNKKLLSVDCGVISFESLGLLDKSSENIKLITSILAKSSGFSDSTLFKLPNELLINIIKFLGIEDLISLSKTNFYANKITEADRDCYKSIEFADKFRKSFGINCGGLFINELDGRSSYYKKTVAIVKSDPSSLLMKNKFRFKKDEFIFHFNVSAIQLGFFSYSKQQFETFYGFFYDYKNYFKERGYDVTVLIQAEAKDLVEQLIKFKEELIKNFDKTDYILNIIKYIDHMIESAENLAKQYFFLTPSTTYFYDIGYKQEAGIRPNIDLIETVADKRNNVIRFMY